jgi:PadR family transcriptional regulator PadR
VLYLTLLGMCCSDLPHRRMRHPPVRHRAFPERGWIQFLLLRLLYEKPMHGYQLIDELESRGYTRPGRFETGSIYTILKRMEMRGLLTSRETRSETGRARRVYEVTQMGVDALKSGLEAVNRRKKLMNELASFYEEKFEGGKSRESTTDEEKTE